MTKTKRILHVTGSLGYGGVPLMLKTYYDAINKSEFQFDFLHHGQTENYHHELITNGAKIFRIETLGKNGLRNYIKSIINIIRENGPYDIIHIHTNYQAGIVAYAAKRAGIKHRIVHMRGIDIPTRKLELLLPSLKLMMIKYGTEFIANSEMCGRFYFKKNNFKIFKNAIDLEKYITLSSEERNIYRNKLKVKDEIVISHIGRMSNEKNHRFSLKLFKHLLSMNETKFKMFFIGDGDLRESLEQESKKTGIYNHMDFLGVREDIPQLLTATDVLILPSFSEGFGNVVLQGQAAGVPCIVSDKVPVDVDMGLNLVSFLGINESDIPIWAEHIKSVSRKSKVNRLEIKSKIENKGYDLTTLIRDLEKYYKDLLTLSD